MSKINILKGNYFTLWIDIMVSRQKVTESDFQRQKSTDFFQLRIPIYLGAHFLQKEFFDNFYFQDASFLKWCLIFYDLPLCQFTKHKNFFWGYWFLAKIKNSTTYFAIQFPFSSALPFTQLLFSTISQKNKPSSSIHRTASAQSGQFIP